MLAAAARSGDDVWPLPLNAEHEAAIASDHADIVNLGLTGPGKPSQCAAFLRHFLKPGVRWAHLDIAGVVQTPEVRGPYVVGPTGYGVRLLCEFVMGWGGTGDTSKRLDC